MPAKLLYLYGPPASGKLTIATAIAAMTGMRLFHNHATLDLAREVYPAWGGQLFGLSARLRLAAFDYAAGQGTDLVFTNVYTGDDEDRAFVAEAVLTVQSHDGEVLFTRLHAPVPVLLSRAASPLREAHRKITDWRKLQGFLERNGTGATVPYESFTVDTFEHQPAQAAQLIVNHFGLKAMP